ncbi:unnamed protein product [Brassica oleracea]|uniref:Uncharacterized protein n=1 Tax=Brassica oleracea TaxID=3712 RepID=A0A3P6B3L7_BRAOL|nr:unnamed protein product [Brassica oleracea]
MYRLTILNAIQTGSFKIDSHRSARPKRRRRDLSVAKMTAKPIGSPIPVAIYRLCRCSL